MSFAGFSKSFLPNTAQFSQFSHILTLFSKFIWAETTLFSKSLTLLSLLHHLASMV